MLQPQAGRWRRPVRSPAPHLPSEESAPQRHHPGTALPPHPKPPSPTPKGLGVGVGRPPPRPSRPGHALSTSFSSRLLIPPQQTQRTRASSPGDSRRKGRASSTSSFSTCPRRRLSVFSNQVPTWRGPQGKTTGCDRVGGLGCVLGWALPVDPACTGPRGCTSPEEAGLGGALGFSLSLSGLGGRPGHLVQSCCAGEGEPPD